MRCESQKQVWLDTLINLDQGREVLINYEVKALSGCEGGIEIIGAFSKNKRTWG